MNIFNTINKIIFDFIGWVEMYLLNIKIIIISLLLNIKYTKVIKAEYKRWCYKKGNTNYKKNRTVYIII